MQYINNTAPRERDDLVMACDKWQEDTAIHASSFCAHAQVLLVAEAIDATALEAWNREMDGARARSGRLTALLGLLLATLLTLNTALIIVPLSLGTSLRLCCERSLRSSRSAVLHISCMTHLYLPPALHVKVCFLQQQCQDHIGQNPGCVSSIGN